MSEDFKEWTTAKIDSMSLRDTGIDPNQLTWMLRRCTQFILNGGGTFRCFVEDLGSDYSHVYCCGGMEFTNAVSDALHDQKKQVAEGEE